MEMKPKLAVRVKVELFSRKESRDNNMGYAVLFLKSVKNYCFTALILCDSRKSLSKR